MLSAEEVDIISCFFYLDLMSMILFGLASCSVITVLIMQKLKFCFALLCESAIVVVFSRNVCFLMKLDFAIQSLKRINHLQGFCVFHFSF